METGKTKEWIEMDGKSFYRFLASDEARGRRFVRIAESVAYTVCQHFGIDTSDYSFGYIAM